MEFPPQWECFPAEQFSSATPRSAGELGLELLVQVRPNGRMLDHFQVAVGGSKILNINFALADILASPRARSWRMKMQVWPRDVEIRRNMMTSTWRNLESLVSAKECQVVDCEGEEESSLPPEAVVEAMKADGVSAAIRFAVAIGGDQRLVLALQGLPASADQLMGKPAFRG
jgi:hypothetical protein